ncbi:MAG: 3-oxoacyl-[acyl-carrier-protein] reductase [Deltaproteobacteria bacterium]|nr:3-oxoacyl-[acyl-carrier-protein] reductase [Deltaproteobacteria bacterium]
MFGLDGRVAVVTGGSRGIGRAVAQALARQGAQVVINYAASEAAAGEVAAAIQSAGGRADLARFDVADEAAVEKAFREIRDRYGRTDILVNNAGVAVDGLLLRVREPDLERMLSVNVKGAIWCARAATRTMMRARWGRIITMSSVVGEMGNVGQVAYSAAKAALVGMTKSLAREYASRSITVNAVAPGFIETDMTSSVPAERKDELMRVTPLGRFGTPDDVAAAVAFLASEEAGFITGEVLRVNGGLHM